MAEYWGARVTSIPAGAAAYAPTRYGVVRQDFGYTKAPGSDGADDIETINRKIMNQHPEDISLLADRWQNAHDVLVMVKSDLFLQGCLLEGAWRESQARDIFLEKGPGTTLAYLDDWIEATNSNKEALRALVTVAESSRKRMSEIWADYKRDIAAARDISRWDEIQEELQIWQGWRLNVNARTGMFGLSRDTGEAKEQAAREAVNAVHERYNRIAQDHASAVAKSYGEVFTKVNGGHGALFEPMNVVFNPPHPALPGMPGAPPGAPGVPGVPGAPSIPAQLYPVAPPVPPQVPQEWTATANVTAPPVPPTLPAVSPTPPGPPDLPQGMPAPPVLPAAAPPVLPATGPVPGLPPKPSVGRGALPSGTTPGPSPNAPRPGVHNGVLRAPNTPAAPSEAPPSMPQSPGNLGRKPNAPDGEDTSRRPATVRPVDSEGDFSSPPPPSSPVLSKPRQAAPRVGGGGPPSPGVPRRADPAAPDAPDGTVSPVLRAPSTGQGRLPPAGRAPVAEAVPPATPGSDWIGADAARVGARDPLLGRPKPAADQPDSRLEEVPEGLRRRRVAAPTGPEAAWPGDVAAELAPRRAVPEVPVLDETPPDEEAFTVETPGGGVIGKQPERTDPRAAEPPPLLGRG